MTDRDETFDKVAKLIESFNKKGVALTEATSFAGDLEWDSLIVLDFVASVEDEFDILITMNMQAEIETVGQLVDAVEELRNDGGRKPGGRRWIRPTKPASPLPTAAISSPSSTP